MCKVLINMNRKIIKELLQYYNIKYSPNSLRIFMNKHLEVKQYCEVIYNKNSELWETPLNVLKCIYKFNKFYFKKCVICGKKLSYSKTTSKHDYSTCSYKCARKNDNKEQVLENRRKTCLIKYGVNSYSKTKMFIENVNKNPDIKRKISNSVKKSFKYRNLVHEQNKRQETCLLKYGYKCATQAPEVKCKIFNTFINNFGVKSNVELTKVREKVKQVNLNKSFNSFIKNTEKYVILLSTKEEFFNKDLLRFKCKACNTEFQQYIYTTGLLFSDSNCRIIPRCPTCHPKHYSIGEQELIEFCHQFFNNLKTHDRTLIKPYELDIVIPELHLALEFNRYILAFNRSWNTIRLSPNEN